MQLLSNILIGIVAFEHLYILWLEMFAWETAGKKAFKGSLADEMFKPTKKLAANQGLYNGFLAAGLVCSLLICFFRKERHYSPYFYLRWNSGLTTIYCK